MTHARRHAIRFSLVAMGLLLAALTVILGMAALVYAQPASQAEVAAAGTTGPDAGNSDVTASPGTIRADGSSTATLTARARNGDNNTIPGAFVGFTTTSGTTNYAFAEAESAAVTKSASGAWSEESVTGASSGKVIRADGALNPGASASWAFSGAAVNLRYRRASDGGMAQVQIDSGTPITIDAYAGSPDWQNFSQTELGSGPHTISVTATTSHNPSSGGFRIRLDSFQAGATTAANGNATGILTAADLASGSQTAIVYATIVGSKIVETTTVVMEASRPNSVTLSADNDSIAVGGSTTTLRAQVDDQFDADVRDGTIVTFTTDLGSVGSDTVTKTTAAGEVTATLTSGTSQGTATITATVGAVTDTTTVELTAAEPGTITVSANPDTVVAGSAMNVTAVVTDSFGNTVEDGTPIDFTGTQGGVFSSSAVTTSGGTAMTIYTPTMAGRGFITATGSAAGGTAITVTADVPASLSLTAEPTSVRADGVATSTLTALVRDTFGNATPGETVTFTTDLGEVDSGSSVTKTTDVEGEAAAALSGTTAGTATVTATVGSAITDTASVTLTPGVPTTVTVTAVPLTVGCGSTVAITAAVVDQFGNGVTPGTSVTFTTDLTGSFTTNPVATDGNGEAATSFAPAAVGTGTITATADSAVGTATVTVEAGGPGVLELARSEEIISVSGGPGPTASVIRATVRDGCENLVGSGETVTFTTSLGTVDGGSTTTKATDAGGHATATLTAGGVPGRADVTVTAASVVESTFVYIAGGAAQVEVSASPPTVTVDGGTATVTATVGDAFDNPVVNGTAVTFSVGAGHSISPAVGSTVGGEATTTFSAGTVAGPATVTATADSAVGVGEIAVSPAGLGGFEIAPVSGPQEVGELFVIVITARDVHGNVKTDYAGPATVTDTTKTVQPLMTGSFTDGVWQGEVTVLKASMTRITVMDGAVEESSNWFRVDPTDFALLYVFVEAEEIEVGGATSEVTVIVKDRLGNNVPDGTTVTFTTDLGTFPGGVSTTTRPTFNGIARVDLTSGGSAGVARVRVESGALSDEVRVRFLPGGPAEVTLTASPGTITPEARSTTLVADVADEFGNPVRDGTAVTFTTSVGTFPGGVTTATGTTSGGSAAVQLRAGMVPGRATVRAAAGTVFDEIEVPINIWRIYSPHVVRNAGEP